MADVQHTPRLSQSHIPVFTPRKSQSSLPSALTTPQLGLVPPSRHLSVSGSPTHPSPGGSTSSSTSGGLTPFRSFRSLFSTGSGKHTPNTPKTPFASLASIRKSIHGERSVSAPHLRPQRSYEEESPVLEIYLPRTEPLMSETEFNHIAPRLSTSYSTPTLPRAIHGDSHVTIAPAIRTDGEASIPPSPPELAATDLSTIIEAENSGISKHIPILDDSEEEVPVDNRLLRANSQELRSPSQRTPSSESSVLDLSTSKVTTEVMEAMSATGRTEGWLHGVVVDDTTDNGHERDALAAHGALGDPDVSFNLSALDPDLAVLLSPNRLGSGRERAASVSTAAVSPSLPSPTRSESRHPRQQPELPLRSVFSDATRTQPPSVSSSPERRAGVLPRRTPSKLPSTALPRLARSVSDRPALQRLPTAPPIDRAESHSPDRVTATSSLRTPRQDHTVLASEDRHHLRPHDLESYRPGISRLLTSARSTNHLSHGNSSRPPSRQMNRTPPSAYDISSPGTSRPSTSSGIASSRPQTTRPSLDGIGDRLQRSTRVRNRERSASVVEYGATRMPAQHSRPTAEWLGPRTAKAFAAAGLLDFDREVGRRTPSRFGTARSSIDDSRSRYTPSRMAFSEAGSTSSLGRRSGSISRAGSISRTVTASEPLESVSTPRTTFSSASTAPTSISASSSHLQSELQLLQERHSVETGALLSALADSQRTTRVLRDENTQLRDKLQSVEERLADALEQIHRLQQHSPPKHLAPAPRLTHSRFATEPAERPATAGAPHPRLRTFMRLDPDPDPQPSLSAIDADSFDDTRRKRASTSSSLFPGPSSSMDMLMHEESISGSHSRSGSPSSPTLVLARLDAHKQSNTSAGNISPTTANFSIMTGSPGSLNLRPEHELHLDDMPSLDLGMDVYEDDA